MSTQNGFHVVTPLLESAGMSKRMKTTVYLKMENLQPTGSFKIRGIGYLCQNVASSNTSNGVICSSGGNAGMATAYAARKLNLPATIVLTSATPQLVADKLKDQGATVKVAGGKAWDDANAEALRLAEVEGLTVIPPFDHPLVWKGHTSLVRELKASLPSKPGAVVLSVGGGGLFCGVIQGLDEVGWGDVPILCMETVGADCFNTAIKAGELVTLPEIRSEATCLGAKTACQQAFEYSKRPSVISEVVTDLQALEALELFLDEERVLVELACGAALAGVYGGVVQRLQGEGRLPKPLHSLVMIVCGGGSVNLAQLQHLQRVIRQK